jgi:hypothetical protein
MNRFKQLSQTQKDGHDLSGRTKTIRLTDLIPKKTIKGGSQIIFGSESVVSKKKNN